MATAAQDLTDSLQRAGIFSAGVDEISDAIVAVAAETGGVGEFSELSDAATADLPATNVPLAEALDEKAPGGALIAYAGTSLTLTAAHNGNIVRTSSASSVAVTVPTGLPAGFTCLIVQGGAGLVTAAAGAGASVTANPALVTLGLETDLVVIPSGTDTYTIYSTGNTSGATTLAELTDIATYNLGTGNTSVAAIKATADAALAGGTTLCVISGTRGTGNTLTATVANGYAGTFQWQSLVSAVWTNVVSGGTSSTHVELVGDLNRDIRCVFTPTTFTTNTLVQPAPVFTAQSPPDGSVGVAYTYSYVATGATSYAVASGSLPAGLSLNTSTGAITGTPTTAATSVFVISATNTGGTTNASSQDIVIVVSGVAFTDDFNRADSAGSLGSPWVNRSGSYSIATNKAESDSSAIVTRPGNANGSWQATAVLGTTWVLVYRFIDTNNYWAMQWDGTNAQLYKLVAGSATTIIGNTAASGTTLKAVYSGNSHSIYMNGVQVGSTATDSDNAAGTEVGFRAYAPSQSFDNAVCTT